MSSTFKRLQSRPARVDEGGVEERNIRVLWAHEQANLRAAEDDALRAARSEVADDAEKLGAGAVAHLAAAELIEDHAVHERAILLVRREHGKAAPLEDARVEVLLHSVTGT